MKNLIKLAVLIALSQSAFAEDEFDFVIVGASCKMLVSYNVISDESLKVLDADKPIMFCERNGKKISCKVSHVEEIEKEEVRKYKLELDSPPIMFIQAENGSDTLYINTSENAASYSSRILDEKLMAQKVCNGLFFTYDQYKLMSKNN